MEFNDREFDPGKLIELLLLIIIVYFFVKLFPFFKNILSFVFKVTLPFLLGFIIAFIFEPLIEKLSKKINRKMIVIIINAILIGGIILFVRFFVPFLIKQLNAISDQIPSYIDQIKAIFAKFEQKSIIYLRIMNWIIIKLRNY